MMRLEGRAVGEWTAELDRVWRSIAGSIAPRRLVVDLRDVVHMDGKAIDVLAGMHRESGAHFLAETPMTKYFAEEAQRRGNLNAAEGE
jgi:hypothetical protein